MKNKILNKRTTWIGEKKSCDGVNTNKSGFKQGVFTLDQGLSCSSVKYEANSANADIPTTDLACLKSQFM